MDNKRKISIFLDTNVLQITWGGKNDKCFVLHELGIENEYYNLVKFINENALTDLVEICIPEVVVFEIQQHMIECFYRNVQRFNDQQAQNKKVFGALLDIDSTFKVDVKQYKCYAAKQVTDFLSNSKNLCKTVKHSNGNDLIDTLLYKSLKKQKPFFHAKATSSGKDYSDAGFKDAVILETIADYIITVGTKGIFVSADSDFPDFSSTIADDDSIVHYQSLADVKKALEQHFGISYIELIKNKFNTDKYLQDQLLALVCDYQPDMRYQIELENINSSDNEEYLLDISILTDSESYKIEVQYDLAANEIIQTKLVESE